LHGTQSLSHGVEIKCVITLEVEQTTDKVSVSNIVCDMCLQS